MQNLSVTYERREADDTADKPDQNNHQVDAALRSLGRLSIIIFYINYHILHFISIYHIMSKKLPQHYFISALLGIIITNSKSQICV